jgi:hypothetical protein
MVAWTKLEAHPPHLSKCSGMTTMKAAGCITEMDGSCSASCSRRCSSCWGLHLTLWSDEGPCDYSLNCICSMAVLAKDVMYAVLHQP